MRTWATSRGRASLLGLVLLSLIATALVSCGGGKSKNASSAVDKGQAATKTDSPKGGSGSASALLDLLRVIPDTPESRTYIGFSDYALASALSGLKRPDPSAPAAEVLVYKDELTRLKLAEAPGL